jgi:hypothetical protein
MLYDPAALIKTEYVHSSPISISRPFLAGVKNNMVSFCKGPDKMNMFSWVFTIHALKVFNEGLLPVANHGIVLDVF